jgi:hypothetical protein
MSAWRQIIHGTEGKAVRRALLLVGCLGLGSVVGAIGTQASGSDWWYVAIPAAVAMGWLLVANPVRADRILTTRAD